MPVEANGEARGSSPKIPGLFREFPGRLLLTVLAGGEPFRAVLEAGDQSLEAGSFRGDMGLPALMGLSLPQDQTLDGVWLSCGGRANAGCPQRSAALRSAQLGRT